MRTEKLRKPNLHSTSQDEREAMSVFEEVSPRIMHKFSEHKLYCIAEITRPDCVALGRPPQRTV